MQVLQPNIYTGDLNFEAQTTNCGDQIHKCDLFSQKITNRSSISSLSQKELIQQVKVSIRSTLIFTHNSIYAIAHICIDLLTYCLTDKCGTFLEHSVVRFSTKCKIWPVCISCVLVIVISSKSIEPKMLTSYDKTK